MVPALSLLVELRIDEIFCELGMRDFSFPARAYSALPMTCASFDPLAYSPNGVNFSKNPSASLFASSNTRLLPSSLTLTTHGNGFGRILNPSV